MLLNLNQEILLFIWKWKLCSSSALGAKFFPNIRPNSAFKRLQGLRKMGLIEHYCDRTGSVTPWTLTKKGFTSIFPFLPELREVGFQSETLIHDHLVTAIHLGDWLREFPDGCELISEQELRRLHIEHYPDWVPKSKIHRPDGYWYLGPKECVVALEVEISRKSHDFYISTCQFYKNQERVKIVLWVVENIRQASGLAKLFEEWGSPSQHQFICLDSVRKFGWNAPISIGSKAGNSIHQLLVTSSSISPHRSDVQLLLDTSKIPKYQMVTPATQKPQTAIDPLYRHQELALPQN